MKTSTSLTDRILRRIEEYPRHGDVAGSWVHGPLTAILSKHPESNGTCDTCASVETAEVSTVRLRVLSHFPCPTVLEVMDAIAFTAWELAHAAVDALVADSVAGGAIAPLTVLRRPEQDLTNWFVFEAVYTERGVSLHIPGLELAELRPGPDGSVKQLARLLVGESAWVWPSAVSVLAQQSRSASGGHRP